MAKISANGATKVAERKVRTVETGTVTVYVLCSDGRMLRKLQGLSSYSVMSRNIVRAEFDRYIDRILDAPEYEAA